MSRTLTVAHLYVIPKGRSTRQAAKESHRGSRGKSAPGSPAERGKSNLAFASGAVRVRGRRERRGTARPGDQLQRRAPQLSEAQASSDSWFYFRSSPSVKNRMDLRGGGGWGGWLCGRSCSFFSLEVPNMPLHLCHVSLIGTGKHAGDHPSL